MENIPEEVIKHMNSINESNKSTKRQYEEVVIEEAERKNLHFIKESGLSLSKAVLK